MQAVALFRTQLERHVFDQWPVGWRQLELGVEGPQQAQDLPVLGSHDQLFLLRQGLCHRFRPVGQGEQIAVLVQLDTAAGNA
ncbi:hypothetical protein D3C84_1030940 [compost metagenome]